MRRYAAGGSVPGARHHRCPSHVNVMRISQSTEAGGAVVLKLGGKVCGEWVDELRRLTWGILQEPATRLVLDLADVSFIDAVGLELLHELSSRHVVLRNASLFVAQQLKAPRAIEEKP